MNMIEERKRILKLVEEGKLTAEEALLLIEKLEEKSTSGESQGAFQEQMATELSTNVNSEGSQHKKENASFKQSSTKVKFLDFIDSALKKIKDFDLDFNFGNAVEIQHIFQNSNSYINQIDLDVANGSVKLVPWNEEDVRVECNAKVYRVETQDEARKSFLQDVLFSIERNRLVFSVQKKQMKVNAVLYIPQTDYEKIKVRMFNGPISGENLQVNEFKAKTANGSIDVKNIRSVELELETANGHIKAERCSGQELEAETINGTLSVNGSFGKVDLQSFNGNIICALQDGEPHTAHMKTTTGNIDLFVPTQVSIDGELKTNLGSFKCEIPNIEIVEEKSEVVQKSLRFQSNKQNVNVLHVFAETKTGSVIVKPSGGA